MHLLISSTSNVAYTVNTLIFAMLDQIVISGPERASAAKAENRHPGADTGAVSTTTTFGQECVDKLGRHTGNTHTAHTRHTTM